MTKNKAFSTNRFILPVLFIVFSVIIEVVNFAWLGLRGPGGGIQLFPSYFLFDLGAILLFAGLIYLVSNKHAMLAIFYILLLLQLILGMVNATIFKVFGDIFTFDLIKLGAEATAAIRPEFIDWASVGVNLGILAVIITITAVMYAKNKTKVRLKVVSNWVFGLAMVILIESCGITMFALQQNSLRATDASSSIVANDSYLWDNLQFKVDAYQKFGYYGFYYKNIYNVIFSKSALTTAEKKELESFIAAGETDGAAFEAPLKTDNLIVILSESLEWFAIDPILTPTIWKLANGGASSFTNFYSRNKTNVSEDITLLGNMPKQSQLSDLVQPDAFDYSYTLPKLLKAADPDIQTTYIHSYLRSFYDRDSTYLTPGLGFDNIYGLEDYTGPGAGDYTFGNWVGDVNFFENMKDKMLPTTGRFFTYFATISTHGPYHYENPNLQEYYDMYDANEEEVIAWIETNTAFTVPSRPDQYQQFRRYKAAAIDYDHTVASILQTLEERNQLADTTVVLFGDHNCYYNNLGFDVKNIDKTDYSNTETFRVPLIIYNEKLEKGQFDMFCNTYDVFPTICQLYGLSYNKNLAQGYNVFSSEIEDSFFASNLMGMFDANFFSLNIQDIVPLRQGLTEVDAATFRRKAEAFYLKQDRIEKVYRHNLAGA